MLIKIDNNLVNLNIKDYFDQIYTNRLWVESKFEDKPLSGNGSSIYNTTILIKELPYLLQKYNIKNIVDCGCGSFNYLIPLLDFFNDNIDNYTGIDIVDSVIIDNNNKFSNDKIKFISDDICNTTKVNNTDLVICKEVLMHLSTDLIFKFLKNIKNSNCKYILVSSFRNFKPLPRYDGFSEIGAFHRHNLFDEPFNFKGPLEVISQNDNNDDHKLYLWNVSDIPEL